jgi:hypothetical protein
MKVIDALRGAGRAIPVTTTSKAQSLNRVELTGRVASV